MNDLSTRRAFLGAAATIAAASAAAVALPASVAGAEPTATDSAPTRGLSTWRDPAIMARLNALEEKFKATLTVEQDEIWRELSDIQMDQMLAEQERFVEALGQHMPGLAKAIEIVASWHGDIITDRCCEVRYI